MFEQSGGSIIELLYLPAMLFAVVAMVGVAVIFLWPVAIAYGVARLLVGKERAEQFTWRVLTVFVLVVCVLQVVMWTIHPLTFFVCANRAC